MTDNTTILWFSWVQHTRRSNIVWGAFTLCFHQVQSFIVQPICLTELQRCSVPILVVTLMNSVWSSPVGTWLEAGKHIPLIRQQEYKHENNGTLKALQHVKDTEEWMQLIIKLCKSNEINCIKSLFLALKLICIAAHEFPEHCTLTRLLPE